MNKTKGTILSDTIVARIQKLLALAGSSNENEAALAAEKAQELMLKHNISMAILNAKGNKNDIIGVGEITIDENTRAQWKITLANTVAKSMGGKVIFTPWSRWNEGALHFFGPTDALPVMVDLYRFLKRQIDGASVVALKEYKLNPDIEWDTGKPVHGKTYRNNWIRGCVSRLGRRLTVAYSKQVNETEGAANALVVVGNRVDDLIKETYGKTRTHTTRPTYNQRGYQDGHRAGGHMNLGQTQVGHGRHQIGAGL